VRGRRNDPGTEPGTHDGTPIADKPLQAMQLAWFQMECLNQGYVATVIWTLEDAWYDRFMPYGVIGRAKDGWPTKPAYHMLRLFTHTIQPGWRAMKVTGRSDAASGSIVSAAKGPEGAATILALNTADEPVTLSIAIGGLDIPPDRALHMTVWNADGKGTLSPPRAIPSSPDRRLRLSLTPQSLAAITTSPPKLDERRGP
jgi:hypothetical protein